MTKESPLVTVLESLNYHVAYNPPGDDSVPVYFSEPVASDGVIVIDECSGLINLSVGRNGYRNGIFVELELLEDGYSLRRVIWELFYRSVYDEKLRWES